MSYREFCDLRKEFLEKTENKPERRVSIVTFEHNDNNNKPIKVVERDSELEVIKFKDGNLKINAKLDRAEEANEIFAFLFSEYLCIR